MGRGLNLPVLMSAPKTACKHRQSIDARQLPIHCPPHRPRQPPARRPHHHVLPLDRLPGRPACCPPAGPPPDPAPGPCRTRLRLVPVRGRRGQGRQVRQPRLRRPHDDARAGCKGRHPLPAAARPDRGPRQLRIPGMHWTPLCAACMSSTDANGLQSTERRSTLRIVRESELLGAALNSYHSRENIVLETKFLRDDLPYFVELLAEVASKTKYQRAS
jgi:hypothetical protein